MKIRSLRLSRGTKIYLLLVMIGILICWAYLQVWRGFEVNQARYQREELGLGRDIRHRWAEEYPGTMPERQTGFASDYPTEEEKKKALIDATIDRALEKDQESR